MVLFCFAMGSIGKQNKFVVPENGSPSGFRSCVTYAKVAGKRIVIAVGPTGADISFDHATTWESIKGDGFHAVKSHAEKSVIWASGANGRIGKLLLSD